MKKCSTHVFRLAFVLRSVMGVYLFVDFPFELTTKTISPYNPIDTYVRFILIKNRPADSCYHAVTCKLVYCAFRLFAVHTVKGNNFTSSN